MYPFVYISHPCTLVSRSKVMKLSLGEEKRESWQKVPPYLGQRGFCEGKKWCATTFFLHPLVLHFLLMKKMREKDASSLSSFQGKRKSRAAQIWYQSSRRFFSIVFRSGSKLHPYTYCTLYSIQHLRRS